MNYKTLKALLGNRLNFGYNGVQNKTDVLVLIARPYMEPTVTFDPFKVDSFRTDIAMDGITEEEALDKGAAIISREIIYFFCNEKGNITEEVSQVLEKGL